MARYGILCLMAALTACVLTTATAATLFEDDFNDGDGKWTLIPGGGEISIEDSETPEYGPKALVVSSPAGVNVLAYAEMDLFSDGYIEVLWRDQEIGEGAVADRDADGPLIFRDQDQTFTAVYLIEFDADTGFHFDAIGGGGVAGAGPKSAGQWSWIKVRAEGSDLQAKVWDAGDDEPDDWMIELDSDAFVEGSVGIRAWSGTAEVAYFRVSDLDGPTPLAVDARDKASLTWGSLKAAR